MVSTLALGLKINFHQPIKWTKFQNPAEIKWLPQGVLAMFAYRGVCAMFLGLKSHLKAISLGLKFADMNFPILGGKNFQQLPFSLGSVM